MALDFPSPVSSGAIYTGTNGVTYYYDGIKWQGEIPVPTDLDTGLVQYYDNKIQNTTSNIVFVGSNNSATITISNSGTITFPNGAVIKDVSGHGISFGQLAGAVGQAAGATAIGYLAGYTNQSIEAVAVGDSAGQTTQGVNAVAIGAYKGDSTNVRDALRRQFPGFSEYISYSFTWSGTSEGDDFWRGLHRHSAETEEGCI